MAGWQLPSLLPLLFCLTFLLLGLLVNSIQLLLLLTLPTQVFRRINYYLMYSVYGYLLFLGDWWSGAKLTVYAEEELAAKMESPGRGAESSLILMNHHTELDWLYSWMGADRIGLLGNCKCFAKNALKFAPIIGWAWSMSDTVFLKRNWEEDRETMSRKLNTMFSAPSPVWLVLFPEGTRFSPEKHAASEEFAKKASLPPLLHHLQPRTKGFSFAVATVDRSKLKSVLDVTLVESSTSSVPFSLASIQSGLPVEGSLLMRRTPLEEVPSDPEASAVWLQKLWKEKDQLKDTFLKTGSFGPSYREVAHGRRLPSLLLFTASNIVALASLGLALVTGGIVIRTVILGILGLAWVLLARLSSEAKLEDASHHGLRGNEGT